MSAHIFAVVNAGTITNTMMLDPELAPLFGFLGELVDLDKVKPQPGIGWTLSGGAWSAPEPPPPVQVPDPTPVTPREGETAMATVTDDDPLTIDVAGVSYPARRLQAYTPVVGDQVKATWLDGGWVVEDAIEPAGQDPEAPAAAS